MEKIEVIINEDRITAKEVNPYKDELDREYALGHSPSFNLLEAYRCYASIMRTFEIDSIHGLSIDEMPFSIQNMIGCGPGTRHTATILKNGKVKIL